MHLSKTLLLVLAAASAGIASPAPIDLWPFNNDDDKCEPCCQGTYDASTFFMKFYSEPNCDSEWPIIKADTRSGYDIDECYEVPSGTRSFHGVAHTDHRVTWYSDRHCKNAELASQHGQWKDKADIKGGDIQSFYIRRIKDEGPSFPRNAVCGQVDDDGKLKDDYRESTETKSACFQLLQDCKLQPDNIKNKTECPGEAYMYKSDVNGVNSCVITTPRKQSYFDEYCEIIDSNLSCLRAVGDDYKYAYCSSSKGTGTNDTEEEDETTTTLYPTPSKD